MLIKIIIRFMGNVYVFLDKYLEHETSPILGMHIDYDLQEMSRRELCNHIEKRFGLQSDSFWELESTQKIRLGCQLARNSNTLKAEVRAKYQKGGK